MISRHSYLEESKKKVLIAVYDSLRDNMIFNKKLERCYKVGDFISLPKFCLMDVGATEPVLLNNFNMSVVMEVYEITKDVLETLDIYYGFVTESFQYTDLNKNNRIEIETPYGVAYTYVNNQPINKGKIIPFGDWKDYNEYSNKMNIPQHIFNKTTK